MLNSADSSTLAARIRTRQCLPSVFPESVHPVLRRVYAARGIGTADDLAQGLGQLLDPAGLKGIEQACQVLIDAIRQQRRIVVAGDYDADGATATAVAVLGLRMLGAAHVDFVVPNRFTMGYGLSPGLVAHAQAQGAQLIVTVDNGIASLSGVAAAHAAGIPVVITDHHLAGTALPQADAIVNPNQPECSFASKALAGVGVMFYVLLALRAEMRRQGFFKQLAEPNLASLLDLVALGTVADLVRLDHNNRILVAQGLARIRAGRARPGILALLECAGRSLAFIQSSDLGFALGPRLNAAGRLDDMREGIMCLLADDPAQAKALAHHLDSLNRERRGIEAQMREEAFERVMDSDAIGVTLFDDQWHEGVVGLVASRVKDALHRPTFAFAKAHEAGMLKGSGRSISALHLRDALAAVDAQTPGLIVRFGGHAMAAGLSIEEARLDEFAQHFDDYCRQQLDAAALEQLIETDGQLSASEFNIEAALALESGGPWGQGFPEPMFEGKFRVREFRLLGEEGKHVRYRLEIDGRLVDAVHFGGGEQLIERGAINALFRLIVNRFRGEQKMELRIEHLWSDAPL